MEAEKCQRPVTGCRSQARLSHKSSSLEKSPTSARMWCRPTRLCAESTSANALTSRAVGECDNKRTWLRTYATASGERRSASSALDDRGLPLLATLGKPAERGVGSDEPAPERRDE